MAFADFFKPKQDNGNSNGNTNANNGNNNNNNGNSNPPNPQPNGMTQGMANPNGNNNGNSNDGNNANNGNSQEAANPLDSFKGLFDTANNKEPEKAPSFSIPDDVLKKVAGSLDFTQGIDPELMTKALAGDSKSLLAIINESGRKSYETSLSHLTSLSGQYIDTRLAHEGKTFGSKVKEQMTNSELGTSITNFNHPVVKAELSSKAKELARLHPDASPQEIAKMAKDYVTELANQINPKQQTAEEASKASEVQDWDKYLA